MHALSLCDTSNFTPTAVHLKNKDTDETILLDVETSKYNSPPSIHKVSPDSDHDKLVATLYVKEKFTISDRAYQEISLIAPDLP